MEENDLPAHPDLYNEKVHPVQRRYVEGSKYVDEYMFDHVDMSFDADKVMIDDVIYRKEGDKLFYRYPGKVPVMVMEDGVYKHGDAMDEAAEQQAYYVLSILDSEGYVSRWRKK